MRGDEFAQDGWMKDSEPHVVHLDDGLLGLVEYGDDVPICGVRGRVDFDGCFWQCILPPGHECRHLRACDEVFMGAKVPRVVKIVSAA